MGTGYKSSHLPHRSDFAAQIFKSSFEKGIISKDIGLKLFFIFIFLKEEVLDCNNDPILNSLATKKARLIKSYLTALSVL